MRFVDFIEDYALSWDSKKKEIVEMFQIPGFERFELFRLHSVNHSWPRLGRLRVLRPCRDLCRSASVERLSPTPLCFSSLLEQTKGSAPRRERGNGIQGTGICQTESFTCALFLLLSFFLFFSFFFFEKAI